MKINRKVLIVLVVMVGAIFWGIDSLNTRSYSGKDLNFGVGSGPVTITNPSDAPVSVQLAGTGSRSFSIVNTSIDVTGSSKRDGSNQLFEFELPSGVSNFTIARGKSVSFTANTDTVLKAIVQPLNAENSQTTLIVVVVVILGGLFYISRTTDHRWIKTLLNRNNDSTKDPQSIAKSMPTAGGQGTNLRSFGDNRANAGD